MYRINNHNNVSEKLKEMTDLHWNKIELEETVSVNKEYKVFRDWEMYIKHLTLSHS